MHFSLWQHIVSLHGKIVGEITAVTRHSLRHLLNDHNITEPRHFFHFVYVVENFDPNALSVEGYAKRDPFDHPSVTQASFDNWQALGLIACGENGRYHITPLGHQLRERRWRLIEDDLNQQPLNRQDALHYILTQFGNVKTAVSHLQQNKWLTKNHDSVQLTPTGFALREAIEQKTNAYFYNPWQQALTKLETETVTQNLKEIQDHFN